MAPIIDVAEKDFERAKKILELASVNYSLPKTETKIHEIPAEQIADLDRSNWIVVPWKFTDGKYSLDVSPERLAYCPAVEKVGKELGINYKNTSKDSLNRGFVGTNDWFQFLKMNLCLGNSTLSPTQFNDFGRLLLQGMQEKIKVYGVSGKQLDSKFLEDVFYDIFGAKSPWRAEWLDADFKVKDKNLYINYNHVLDANGNLIPKNSEILDKNTLMKDKTPGISLDDYFINNHTNQGLPNKKSKSGDLYYLFPRNDDNSVARFYAGGGRVSLNCSGYPSGRDADLGVRGCLARQK